MKIHNILSAAAIVGCFSMAAHADTWSALDLGTFGGPTAQALAINAIGQVVGTSGLLGSFENHAFITGANGVGMTDLNSLVLLGGGDYFTYARAVNDLGQIVAESFMGHSYLLSVSAVPEPETYAMMLVGLGLMGTVVRRRSAEQA